jgi:hypothetical protein
VRRMPGGGLRKVLVGATAALTLAAMAGPASAAPAPAATVEVRGGDILSPGQFIKNNFRFVPRNIAVAVGMSSDGSTATEARTNRTPPPSPTEPTYPRTSRSSTPASRRVASAPRRSRPTTQGRTSRHRSTSGSTGAGQAWTRGATRCCSLDRSPRPFGAGSLRPPAPTSSTCASFTLGCRAASPSGNSAEHDGRGPGEPAPSRLEGSGHVVPDRSDTSRSTARRHPDRSCRAGPTGQSMVARADPTRRLPRADGPCQRGKRLPRTSLTLQSSW